MRRQLNKKQQKLATDGQRLINLSLAVAQSASRLEDLRWQAQLDALVEKNLEHQYQPLFDIVAEQIFHAHPSAYEVLMETVESMASSGTLIFEGKTYQMLLMVAPILAWSRFEISAGDIPQPVVGTLHALWQEHLLAPDARVRVLPTLYAVEQLPKDHCQAYNLLRNTAQSLLKEQPNIAQQHMPETVPFLADSRYLLAVVVAPVESALFAWQNIPTPFDSIQAKNDILTRWQAAATPSAMRLLPGCGVELLMPEAFYTACRESDVRIRPISIRSAVFYLTQTFGIDATELDAFVAAFGEEDGTDRVDEYRISFSLKNQSEVIHGLVWPLYQQDDAANAIGNESDNQLGDIPAILAEAGLLEVKKIPAIFPLEYCDDCDAPLFCNRDGELVHAEMPDDAPNPGANHLH